MMVTYLKRLKFKIVRNPIDIFKKLFCFRIPLQKTRKVDHLDCKQRHKMALFTKQRKLTIINHVFSFLFYSILMNILNIIYNIYKQYDKNHERFGGLLLE